jgi:hypothetical protein
MFKKIGMIFSIIIVTFVLTSCSLKDSEKEEKGTTEESVEMIDLTSELLLKNIRVRSGEEDYLNQINTIDLGSLSIQTSYETEGFLIVSDTEGRLGVYSLIEDKLVVPLQSDVSYENRYDYGTGNYIYAQYLTGETAIYDINGVEILEKDHYEIADVKGRQESIYNENNEFVEVIYLETVTKLLKTDHEDGKSPITTVYKINLESKMRELYHDGSYEWGDYFKNDDKVDLTQFGLKGYYAKERNDYLYIYEETTDELIQSIPVNALSIGQVFSGQLFYQQAVQASDFTDDYTYMDEGKKYQLITASIDLLTGQEQQYDVDYVITGGMMFKDENDIINNIVVRANKIVSKVLIKNREYTSLINTKGQIVADLTGMNMEALRKIDDHHIFDEEDKIMYDLEFNELFRITSSATFDYFEKVIIFKEYNSYGAIDFDGKVVIPFKYKELSSNFHHGKTYGVDEFDRTYLIDKNNSTEVIAEPYRFINDGLLFTYNVKPQPITHWYTGKIINYEGETVKSIGNLVTTSYQNYYINTIYGKYQLLKFNTDVGYTYVSIKLQ